ncbi:hypothetical protein AMECASPLE_039583 [Ameca splendens]|uniref:Uncharacterized protein n=1 Tax=Ameca splendens TaxID=208324 RepID=A0ABV0YJX9_9TELE
MKHFDTFNDYSNIFKVICGLCTFLLNDEDSQDHLPHSLLVVLSILTIKRNKSARTQASKNILLHFAAPSVQPKIIQSIFGVALLALPMSNFDFFSLKFESYTLV